MSDIIYLDIPSLSNIEIQVIKKYSPETVKRLLESIPFSVELNLWGEEIYSSECPIKAKEENPKSLVEINDVAFWPQGRAICLFYGPTPIGDPGEIKPYSPVNIVGRIINPDKSILKKMKHGVKATLREN